MRRRLSATRRRNIFYIDSNMAPNSIKRRAEALDGFVLPRASFKVTAIYHTVNANGSRREAYTSRGSSHSRSRPRRRTPREQGVTDSGGISERARGGGARRAQRARRYPCRWLGPACSRFVYPERRHVSYGRRGDTLDSGRAQRRRGVRPTSLIRNGVTGLPAKLSLGSVPASTRQKEGRGHLRERLSVSRSWATRSPRSSSRTARWCAARSDGSLAFTVSYSMARNRRTSRPHGS